LVLTHFTPPPNNPLIGWSFQRGVGAVRPKGVVMAEDGMLIVLPFAAPDRVDVGTIK
jgi:hypothetical protein